MRACVCACTTLFSHQVHLSQPVYLFTQGLTHLGKGLLSLSPFRSPGILCPQGLAGLIVLAFTAMDMKSTLLNNYHFMLYSLVPAMWPRMLSTVDEELKPLNVSVRVGQAVDVVGQAGKPKTITGFQTHTSPVLIAAGERYRVALVDFQSSCFPHPLHPLSLTYMYYVCGPVVCCTELSWRPKCTCQ